MRHRPRFRFEQRGSTGGTVFEGARPIAEIREIRLHDVVLRPSAPSIIGSSVPIPLYWQQYANHQHPERNAGRHGRLNCLLNSDSKISLEIESASQSRSVTSRFGLDIAFSEDVDSYVFDFRCRLLVSEGKTWQVSHNPSHGELEFCNFWPERSFIPETQASKRYQACFVHRKNGTEQIPHHHLETSDKHDIAMGQGDRFLYLLEDENPVIEICSAKTVAAGLCAYMWDAHFAYRVCTKGTNINLPSQAEYDAHFKLYSIGREEGSEVAAGALARPAPELETIPLYVDGLNTFGVSLSENHTAPNLWPWEHDPEIPGVIEYALDRGKGYGDNASVRIDASRPAIGRWKATTLGPAFGDEPFERGKRFRLSAFVKTSDLTGAARVALRYHRTGIGDVFDLDSYETVHSPDIATGTTDWSAIEVITPEIDPRPDRMHLLLELDGAGTCWFDDVRFERNV